MADHESVRLRPRHLRLDEDGRGQPRGQRRRDRPGPRAGRPTATSSLFPELGVTGYTCADLFGQSALLEAGVAGHARGSPRRRGAAAARRRRPAGRRSATACTTAASAIADGAGPGGRPQAVHPELQGVLREPLVQLGRPAASRRQIDFGGRTVPFGIDLLFDAGGGRGGRGRGLRGPLDADPAQLGRRRSPGRTSCSTSRRATRRSARAGTGPTWWSASRAAASPRTPTPARGRRSRRPTWSSAAIA